jgi:hypothetical protein
LGLEDDWRAISDGDPLRTTVLSSGDSLQHDDLDDAANFAFVQQVRSGKVGILIPGIRAGLTGTPEVSKIAVERAIISHVIQQWIQQAHVLFDVDWLPNERFGQPHLRIQSLAAALAVGLAKAAQNDVFICGNCGMPSTNAGRARKASRSPGRRAYCTACGPEARTVVGQRNRREKMRQQARGETDSQTDSQPSGNNASNA